MVLTRLKTNYYYCDSPVGSQSNVLLADNNIHFMEHENGVTIH